MNISLKFLLTFSFLFFNLISEVVSYKPINIRKHIKISSPEIKFRNKNKIFMSADFLSDSTIIYAAADSTVNVVRPVLDIFINTLSVLFLARVILLSLIHI